MDDSKLNILIVTQYFWPENMRINDLVEGMLKKGHEVTILTGLPNYPEGTLFSEYKNNKKKFSNYKGAKIVRAPIILRGKGPFRLVLNYISFFVNASLLGAYKFRKQRFDSIFVYAVSPIMSAIPAILLGKMCASPVFVWVLDLWPETLSAVGVVKKPFILKCVGRIVSWIYNRADYILIQSKSFKSSILKYCTRPIDEGRIVYFPSWAEDILTQTDKFVPCDVLKSKADFFTIMFAGNIGDAQDFPSIVNVFENLKSFNKIRLVLVGDGKILPWIREQIQLRKLNNIITLGRKPLEEMPGLFAQADALLLALKSDDIFSKTIPGKLQAYLASGKPIIGMIDGEAANVIKESRGGVVGAAGDEAKLLDNILTLFNMDIAQRKEMASFGVTYYQRYFESKQQFNYLEHLFKSASLRKNPMRDTLKGMRIARISTIPFFVFTQLKSQLEHLAASEAEVTIVTSNEDPLDCLEHIKGCRFKPIFIAREISLFADIKALIKLWRLFRKERFHIVHSTTPKAGLLCALAAKGAGVPVCIHTFTGQTWVTMTGFKKKVVQWSDKLIAKLNPVSYTDSFSQRDFLISNNIVPASKIKVIGSGSLAGVDVDRFSLNRFTDADKAQLKASLNIDPKTKILLFVGRVTREKGVFELVEALKQVIRKGHNIMLIVIGPFEQNNEQEIRDCAQGLGNESIRFLGFQTNPELYMAITDLLCLPSYREGFGTVVIEAAAMEVPVVGTNIYGLSDAIINEVTGILVEPKNSVQLADAIEQIVADEPLRERLGTQARERAMSKFDSSHYNELLIQEYKQLFNNVSSDKLN